MTPRPAGQPPARPDPVLVADRLHSAAIHILRSLRPVDRASGLSGPRLSALSVIVFGGPLRMTALARAEQVRAPTMTLVVRGLERSGLVRRVTDPSDRRASLVRATGAGRRLLITARRRRVARLARAVAGASPEERRALLRCAAMLESFARRSAAHSAAVRPIS